MSTIVRRSSITESFHKILHLIARDNVQCFLELIEYIYKNIKLPDNFSKLYSSCLTNDALLSLKKDHLSLFKSIVKFESKDRLLWQFEFFWFVKPNYINAFYRKELMKFMDEIGDFNFPNLEFLIKFQKSQSDGNNVFKKVVSILLKKVEIEEAKIFFGHHFISKSIDYFNSDIENLIKVYLANYNSYGFRFDYEDKEIKILFDKIPDCMDKLIDELPLDKFGFVWEYENYSDYVDKIIDYTKTKENFPGFFLLKNRINYFFDFRNEAEQKIMINYGPPHYSRH